MSRPPEWIAVGRIARGHGVKGDVSILPLSELESRFDPGAKLFAGEDQARPLTVASARKHGNRLLVSFEGVSDRTEADRLRGLYLFVPASSVPPPPEGRYWAHQLVGCEVLTEAGRSIGTIREVVHAPANDVWAAEGAEGEVLVPALKDVVREVDLPGRRVVVREIPGLTA